MLLFDERFSCINVYFYRRHNEVGFIRRQDSSRDDQDLRIRAELHAVDDLKIGIEEVRQVFRPAVFVDNLNIVCVSLRRPLKFAPEHVTKLVFHGFRLVEKESLPQGVQLFLRRAGLGDRVTGGKRIFRSDLDPEKIPVVQPYHFVETEIDVRVSVAPGEEAVALHRLAVQRQPQIRRDRRFLLVGVVVVQVVCIDVGQAHRREGEEGAVEIRFVIGISLRNAVGIMCETEAAFRHMQLELPAGIGREGDNRLADFIRPNHRRENGRCAARIPREIGLRERHAPRVRVGERRGADGVVIVHDAALSEILEIDHRLPVDVEALDLPALHIGHDVRVEDGERRGSDLSLRRLRNVCREGCGIDGFRRSDGQHALVRVPYDVEAVGPQILRHDAHVIRHVVRPDRVPVDLGHNIRVEHLPHHVADFQGADRLNQRKRKQKREQREYDSFHDRFSFLLRDSGSDGF